MSDIVNEVAWWHGFTMMIPMDLWESWSNDYYKHRARWGAWNQYG
jgi:hypothetical protein